jgi:hypothetical protein
MGAEEVFEFLESLENMESNMIVSALIFEIYCGEVIDVLTSKSSH